MKIVSFWLTLGLLATPLWGESTTLSLRNQDPAALLYIWQIPHSAPVGLKTILFELAQIPRSDSLAPGEQRRLSLEAGSGILAVYVPWDQALSYRSLVNGAVLFPTDVPSGRTILLDRAVLQTLAAQRQLSASLQDWGLTVPRFVLDGRLEEWQGVLPAATFGQAFQPTLVRGPQTPAQFQLQDLRLVVAEDCLWLSAKGVKSPGSSPEVQESLALHTAWGLIELPLSGGPDTVWGWSDLGASAETLGRVVGTDTTLEARIVLARFSTEQRRQLLSQPLEVWLLSEQKHLVSTWTYTSLRLTELP